MKKIIIASNQVKDIMAREKLKSAEVIIAHEAIVTFKARKLLSDTVSFYTFDTFFSNSESPATIKQGIANKMKNIVQIMGIKKFNYKMIKFKQEHLPDKFAAITATVSTSVPSAKNSLEQLTNQQQYNISSMNLNTKTWKTKHYSLPFRFGNFESD